MLFGRTALSPKAVMGVVVFTVIEIITLTVWLGVLVPSIYKSPNGVGAIIVLGVGLFVEHYYATQVGKDSG